MGINQAIYTSSVKGISKGGGMGIHSYNRGCSEIELSDFASSYCQYYFVGDLSEVPNLPIKYVYGKSQKDRYIAAQITYLGKDYYKEGGRTGNLLSHMLSFEKKDLQCYPLELYGSVDFLTSIPSEEVDGTLDVDYLPEKDKVNPGMKITLEKVQDFLAAGRMEMFCHLLAAVLSRDNIHKVILYDTHENILNWLAAVEFSLPLKCAREITFSSYEEDPMLSEFDIRGAVVNMSRGNYEEYSASNQFYTFDGLEKKYPFFDIHSDFFQIGIKIGLAYSYDALREFHKFLEKYSYYRADTDCYHGFKLFQMTQGGSACLQSSELMDAMEFEKKYGSSNNYLEIMDQMIEGLKEEEQPFDSQIRQLQRLFVDFYQKTFTERELKHIVKLTLQSDEYLKSREGNAAGNDLMWNWISDSLIRQRINMDDVMSYMREYGAYERLGKIQAHLLKKVEAENINKEQIIIRLFSDYWSEIPGKYYSCFDPVISEMANNLRRIENKDEKSLRAEKLFFVVQKMGEGAITGRGCEALIQMIEEEIDVTDKKLFRLEKRKREKKFSDRWRKEYAVEVLKYTMRYNSEFPVTRIRLSHLVQCIADCYVWDKSMMDSQNLQVYVQCPIVIRGISEREYQIFISRLAHMMSEDELEREEYRMLFRFFVLSKEQKEVLVKEFFQLEYNYFKNEKICKGLVSILGAALDIGDTEYEQAFVNSVSCLRTSMKRKIANILKRKADIGIYGFWVKIIT